MNDLIEVPDLSEFTGKTLTHEVEMEIKRRLEAVGLVYGGLIFDGDAEQKSESLK